MGACGSKDIPSQNDTGRDLSRWHADADESAGRNGVPLDRGGASFCGEETTSDLTLNSVVAYHEPGSTSATAELCATGWEDGSIKILNWKTQALVSKFTPHARAVNRILVGQKTNALYSCSRDTTVAVTPSHCSGGSTNGFSQVVVLSGHTLNVSTIAVDSDESCLCSGGRDTQTILWDLTTGKMKSKNTTAQNVVTCSKWLPGERVIAQGSEDLSVKLWDERNGLRSPSETLRGYIYFPLCLDVSDDGHYLLTSSKGFNGVGCEVRVWDRRMGRQLHQLEGHQQDATACCFLPRVTPTEQVSRLADDTPNQVPTLVTASKDGTVKIWNAPTKQPLCEAHEPSARMFTSISHAGGDVIIASTLLGRVHAFTFDREALSLTLVT